MAAKRATRSVGKRPSPPSPQEIATGVFLGGWKDAEAFEGTRFCVLDEAPEEMPAVTHVPIYDGGLDQPNVANLDRVAREMREAHDRGERVLIFCGHGVRRSPLAAAWYLHRYEQLTLDQAFDRIRRLRPQIELPKQWIGHPEALRA